MPKGVYEHKPGAKRNISEETRAKYRANLEKNKANGVKKGDSEKAIAAKRQNAGKAVAVRTGRAILKHLPVGAKAGDVFQATRYRKITVVDPAPAERMSTDENGVERRIWEQKFIQHGRITIYGNTHEFSGQCRIVWHEKPTLENIMNEPIFEEEERGKRKEKSDVAEL